VENVLLWTTVGTVAAVPTSFGFVPQVRKIWIRRSVGDVSPVTFFQFTAGAALWALYGLSRNDMVVIGANIVTLATVLAGLALYFRYRQAKAQGL
jgi:MtN3 and saliva related transmembrane protein